MAELSKIRKNGIDYDIKDATARQEIEELRKAGGNSDYVLPVGGAELGGVKNGGNVVINADGTMTAPESAGGTQNYTELTNKPKINGVELTGEKSLEDLGIGQPTNEQIESAVSAYLDEHPEATTTVADGSVTPAKTDFLEVVSCGGMELLLTADGYLTYRTDYIDVSGGRSLFIKIIGLTSAKPRAIHIEGSDGNKTVVFSKAALDPYEVCRIKFEADGTITMLYRLNVPQYGEFSYVRVWFGQIVNSETAYKAVGYYSEVAEDGEDYVQLSDKYDMRLVKDGSVSMHHTDFVSYSNPTMMDYTNMQTTGFNTPAHEEFGAAHVEFFADYLELNENHELYIRSAVTGYGNMPVIESMIRCYDAEKNCLTGETVSFTTAHRVDGHPINGPKKILLDDGREVDAVVVAKINASENTKYIRFRPYQIPVNCYDFIIVSKEDIVHLTATPEKYNRTISKDFKELVESCVKTDTVNTMVMVGDSLTNWGGGSDANAGFLKIVHDKTGMITKNEGLAGAHWQTSEGQTACAVHRVDAIIADGRKYDLYCFLMGTNAGANTDTGETSADTSTMPGAIRYCMEKLKAYDPTAQILVCLPPQRAEGNENQEKVNEVIKKIAESYSVKTLDVYHHSGIVPNTVVAGSNYLSDGLHLGENGITALGNLLASEIKYLFCL